MKQVFKYALPQPQTEKFCLSLPVEAEIIKFDYQYPIFGIWALVDVVAEDDYRQVQDRWFYLVGTGWKIDNGAKLKHIDTVVITNTDLFQLVTSFVWHLFEMPEFASKVN